MKKKGFTLVELLVVIAIIALLLAILMPALNKVRQLANRLVCGTNLGGIGKAIYAYSNDYADQYPRFGPAGIRWSWKLDGFSWRLNPDQVKTNWNTDTIRGASITSSLYLLVKYADVSPGAFICKASSEKKFELTTLTQDSTKQNYASAGTITNTLQAWDFGGGEGGGEPVQGELGPWDFCSYSYQQPYPIATGGNSMGLRISHANFSGLAVMADASPWYLRGQIVGPQATGPVQLVDTDWANGELDKERAKLANSTNHGREGQNVLYGDWHVNFEANPCVGIEKDNIYTVWMPGAATETGDVQEPSLKQGGQYPTGYSASATTDISQADDDSFLAN